MNTYNVTPDEMFTTLIGNFVVEISSPQKLDDSQSVLELPTKMKPYYLVRDGIHTVGQLRELTYEQLRGRPGCGVIKAEDIRRVLRKFNISLREDYL